MQIYLPGNAYKYLRLKLPLILQGMPLTSLKKWNDLPLHLNTGRAIRRQRLLLQLIWMAEKKSHFYLRSGPCMKKRNDAQNFCRQCLCRKIILLSLFSTPSPSPLKTWGEMKFSHQLWLLVGGFLSQPASNFLLFVWKQKVRLLTRLTLFLLLPVSVSQPLLIIFAVSSYSILKVLSSQMKCLTI